MRTGTWAQPGQRGYQAEILEALATHDELNVHSGNGIGKDWLAGRIALWWLFTRKDSIVITTAVVEKQVKVILWGELRTAYRRDRHLRGLGERSPPSGRACSRRASWRSWAAIGSCSTRRVGDLYMSLIATARSAKADPFDYLTQCLRHSERSAAAPRDWMPWNYRETIARTPGPGP